MSDHLGIQIVLWAVMAGVLVSAWWVVTLKNLLRAALSLGLVLIGVAAIFVLLEAEFLAFVQILIYVGAILTLVVFAIMLTARLQDPGVAVTNRLALPAALVSGSLFVLLAVTTQRLRWPSAMTTEAVGLSEVGQELITTLVVPFEVISLVFVGAMVGAIAIASWSSSASLPPPPSA